MGGWLLGAAEGLSDTIGAFRGMAGSLIMERRTAALRTQLDEAALAAAWDAGRAMTLEAAIDEALSYTQ